MASVLDLLRKAQSIDMDSITEAVIEDSEVEIRDLNIENLSIGLNRDGELVGTYTKATEEWAKLLNPLAPKKEGEPYNFLWTGDLIGNIFVNLQGSKFNLDSTGTGTGDKKVFIEENKLLGLDQEKAEELNINILPPKYRDRIVKELKS